MIVDMHCHVLPGLDDGPQTMEDALQVLEEVARQGVEAMIVTPHFHPGRYKVNAEKIRKTLKQVEREIEKRNIPIELLPGQECYYYSDLVRELNAGRVLTMADTRYVLVEFDPGAMYTALRNGVRELVQNGYLPIVAHYERYRCLNGNIERLQQLRDDGAQLQMNFDRLLAKDGIFRQNPWRRLLKDGFVDYLGSDTHGMGFRPPHIAECVEWMKKEVEEPVREQILTENIRILLES